MSDAARAEVRRIVGGSGSSFTAGMRILPPWRRRAIFAVYAFCRIVDDIADGPDCAAARSAALDRWDAELDRLLAGRPKTAVGSELAHAIDAFDLPPHEFRLILEGMRMDVAGVVAPAPDELDRYIRRVAGTVGLVSMRIFGAWRGAASERFALALASGVQLVNILRDVAEDARIGRLYIPAPVLAEAGLPLRPDPAPEPARLAVARRRLGAAAADSFAVARSEIAAHDRRRLVPALLMMGPYQRLLRRMERDWHRVPPAAGRWSKIVDGVRCAALGGR